MAQIPSFSLRCLIEVICIKFPYLLNEKTLTNSRDHLRDGRSKSFSRLYCLWPKKTGKQLLSRIQCQPARVPASTVTLAACS